MFLFGLVLVKVPNVKDTYFQTNKINCFKFDILVPKCIHLPSGFSHLPVTNIRSIPIAIGLPIRLQLAHLILCQLLYKFAKAASAPLTAEVNAISTSDTGNKNSDVPNYSFAILFANYLPADIRTELDQLLKKYHRVFSLSAYEAGFNDQWPIKI